MPGSGAGAGRRQHREGKPADRLGEGRGHAAQHVGTPREQGIRHCRVGRIGRGLLTGGCGKPVGACAVAQGRRRAPWDPGRCRANPQACPPETSKDTVCVCVERAAGGAVGRESPVGKRLRECRPHRVGALGAARTVRRGHCPGGPGSGLAPVGQRRSPQGDGPSLSSGRNDPTHARDGPDRAVATRPGAECGHRGMRTSFLLANSSMPYRASSRPTPERLTGPKGRSGALLLTPLTNPGNVLTVPVTIDSSQIQN